MKQIKKVVVYYTDGTYEEIESAKGGGVGTPTPFKPTKESPTTPVIPDNPWPWGIPGEAGKWPYYPGRQPSIVD
jgi:hypothetical protein